MPDEKTRHAPLPQTVEALQEVMARDNELMIEMDRELRVLRGELKQCRMSRATAHNKYAAVATERNMLRQRVRELRGTCRWLEFELKVTKAMIND